MSGVSIASTTSRCCAWTPIGVVAAAAAAAAATLAPVFLAAAPPVCALAPEATVVETDAVFGFRTPAPSCCDCCCCCRWLELSTKVKPSKVSSLEVTLCPSCSVRCVAWAGEKGVPGLGRGTVHTVRVIRHHQSVRQVRRGVYKKSQKTLHWLQQGAHEPLTDPPPVSTLGVHASVETYCYSTAQRRATCHTRNVQKAQGAQEGQTRAAAHRTAWHGTTLLRRHHRHQSARIERQVAGGRQPPPPQGTPPHMGVFTRPQERMQYNTEGNQPPPKKRQTDPPPKRQTVSGDGEGCDGLFSCTMRHLHLLPLLLLLRLLFKYLVHGRKFTLWSRWSGLKMGIDVNSRSNWLESRDPISVGSHGGATCSKPTQVKIKCRGCGVFSESSWHDLTLLENENDDTIRKPLTPCTVQAPPFSLEVI